MMCRSISSPPKAKYGLLYLGADLGLLEFVREALKADSWLVVRCPGGSLAGVLLRSEIHYDLLMLDEVLMRTSGMELVRLARSLEHRKRAPVILLSQKEGTAQAGAGARVFVRKSEPFQALLETVGRLLASSSGK